MSAPPDHTTSGAQAGKTAPLRLFIGIACPCTPAIAALLDDLCDEPPIAVGLRVVAPHNLHITLKFIGSAAANAVPGIVSAMQHAVTSHHAFTLKLQGAGSFQSALWLGVEPNAALSTLASALNEALAPLGFAPETKPYRPHLTLARLTRTPTPVGAGLPAIEPTTVGAYPEGIEDPPAPTLWIAQHQNSQWGTLPVTTVHLYRSETLPDGVRYTVLSTVALSPVQLPPPAA